MKYYIYNFYNFKIYVNNVFISVICISSLFVDTVIPWSYIIDCSKTGNVIQDNINQVIFSHKHHVKMECLVPEKIWPRKSDILILHLWKIYKKYKI